MLEGTFLLAATASQQSLHVKRFVALVLPVEGVFAPPVAAVACNSDENRVLSLCGAKTLKLLVGDSDRWTARPLESDPLSEENTTVVYQKARIAVLTEHRVHAARGLAPSEG